MDRRMYRGNYNRNVSPYRHQKPVCGDVVDRYSPDDTYDNDYCEDGYERERFPIGMCYVPWQRFRDLFDNEFTALANGTIFKELDLDWYGRGCK